MPFTSNFTRQNYCSHHLSGNMLRAGDGKFPKRQQAYIDILSLASQAGQLRQQGIPSHRITLPGNSLYFAVISGAIS
jgi:hypothetical protein